MNSSSLVRGASALAVLASLASAAPSSPSSSTDPFDLTVGAVFLQSNDATANTVIALSRDAGGGLHHHGAYATGGIGSGGGLGNQAALALDRAGRFLLVVNAGSDTVSVFEVGPRKLELRDVEPSGGLAPISVAISGDLVYVLNEGVAPTDGNVTGFTLSGDGDLVPLGSSQPLSGPGVDPAQVGISPDGAFVVVAEKNTNNIVTYAIGADGHAGAPVVSPAAGMTPFGFSFGPQSTLLVSEAAGGSAGASTASSYRIDADGAAAPVTSALASGQSAACWLIATVNGRFAYVTNTASRTVTGYAVARDGSLALLSPDGVSAMAGASPIDADVSRNGRFLYVLNGGDDTVQGYRIDGQGNLAPLRTIGGLPSSVNGLVVL